MEELLNVDFLASLTWKISLVVFGQIYSVSDVLGFGLRIEFVTSLHITLLT
jgi:hypothetical protein